jgi:type II secretory pathway pseudopilin PulG
MQSRFSCRSFTLIEAIMVILIISIFAGSGAWLMANTVKNSVFIPNQMNMDKLVNDALDIMIEGDSQAKGLRFSRVISTIAANRVDFINQDGLTIYYRLDTSTSKLYRSISGAAETALPYYSSPVAITMNGKSGTLFTYYDTNEAVTAVAANVRRIRMILVAKTGTGLYNDWQGQSELASSITMDRLQ